MSDGTSLPIPVTIGYLGRCLRCLEQIPPKPARRLAKYCTLECAVESRAAKRRATQLIDPAERPNEGTKGAMSELVASLALFRLGFEVFRALSPSCSCDLIALKEGRMLRIEVRSGIVGRARPYYFGRARFRADHFAIVLGNEVHFEPPLC